MFTDGHQRLGKADGVQVVTGTRATALETNARGDAVTAAHVVAPGGRRYRLPARAFVLAGGGIENARLLLSSTGSDPAGLGNRHDLVGRFFMEHAYVDVPVDVAGVDQDLTFYGGVVDGHCGVHGVSNLFAAGSSVFPTGGTAGPTLTIVALALRLARDLRERYR